MRDVVNIARHNYTNRERERESESESLGIP